MKRIQLSLFAFLILTTALAQEYIAFPTENASWNIFIKSTCHEEEPVPYVASFYLDGDSTCQGISYSKLFSAVQSSAQQNSEFWGLLREEEKKVFYRGGGFLFNDFNEKEVLLYDFNTEAGDTVFHTDHTSDFSVIIEIDSVLIGENYRKRYKVNQARGYYHEFEYWIEGIGGVKDGLLTAVTDVTTCGQHFWEFICFEQEGETIYLNETYSDCQASKSINSVEENAELNFVTLAYNRVNNSLTINRNAYKGKFSNMEVFNMNGQKLANYPLNGDAHSWILPFEKPNSFCIAIVRDEQGKMLVNYKF